MMVGLFSITITRKEIRVYVTSWIDLFMILFIGSKQLGIVIGSSVLEIESIPVLPLAIIQ